MLLLLPIPAVLPAAGSAVTVAYYEDEAACLLPITGKAAGETNAQFQVEVGPIDHAIADWAQRTGRLVLAPEGEALADCTGFPTTHPLYAPPHGLPVGLEAPMETYDSAGVGDVVSLGVPDWYVVVPDPSCTRPCQGEFVFRRPDGPPLLFSVHNDAEAGPKPVEVHLPPGGATIVTVGPGAAWHWPSDALTIEPVGSRLVVMSSEEVDVVGWARVGSDPPRAVRLSAQGGWGQAKGEPEVAVQLGKKRAFKLDRDIVRHWVTNGSVAAAELKGRRLVVEGLAAGRTHIVLDDGSGAPRLVRITVL